MTLFATGSRLLVYIHSHMVKKVVRIKTVVKGEPFVSAFGAIKYSYYFRYL